MQAQNVLVSVEIVAAAVAQSISFSYQEYAGESTEGKMSLLRTIDEVVSVREVL